MRLQGSGSNGLDVCPSPRATASVTSTPPVNGPTWPMRAAIQLRTLQIPAADWLLFLHRLPTPKTGTAWLPQNRGVLQLRVFGQKKSRLANEASDDSPSVPTGRSFPSAFFVQFFCRLGHQSHCLLSTKHEEPQMTKWPWIKDGQRDPKKIIWQHPHILLRF